MKKLVRILALALVVLTVFSCLTACGGKKIVGKWELSESGITMVWDFQKDGTLVMTAKGMDGLKMEGSWEVKGDKLKLNIEGEDDGEECNFKIKGKKLTIDADGEKIVLTKVK